MQKRSDRLLASIIVAGSAVLIVAALLYARAEALAKAENFATSVVAVLAEQTSRTVQDVDHKMQFVARDLIALHATEQLSQRSTDELLRRHLVGLPFVRALWVLDAKGNIIADSETGNLGINLADREYFQVFRDSGRTRFFLGAPVRSRSVGTWLISAAFPLRDENGVLLGVLIGALKPPYFEKLWGAIDLGPHGSIDLYREDGVLMVSSLASEQLGTRQADSKALATADAHANMLSLPLRAGARADKRMVVGTRLDHYPQLIIVAQRTWGDIFAKWYQFGVLIVAIWAVFTAGVVVLYVQLRRIWQQRSQAIAALSASEDKFSAAFRASPDAIMLTRATDGAFLEVSDSVGRMTGYQREDFQGRSSADLDLWAVPAEREQFFATLKDHGTVSNVEADFKIRSGEIRTGNISAELFMVGGQPHVLSIIRDVTETKRREELIWVQAHFDSLTMLPNRDMFLERLAGQINSAAEQGAGFTLLIIDLDEFKEVNDTLGHDKGDHLLIEVARRLVACLPPESVVARLGGDEFAVILPGTMTAAEVSARLTRVVHELSAPFTLDVDRVFVSASVGVAPYPSAGLTLVELMRHADQAMYAAKHGGRNRFFYFHQGLQDAVAERARLTYDLRGALAANQLEVYYQPIVSLATGRMHKAEALLRWHHPTRGFVSPVEFIALAESSGLILEIGEWVFAQAVDAVAQIRRDHDPDFAISVNVSPVQIHSDHQLGQRWIAQLAQAQLPPSCITVEVTEGVLLDLSRGASDSLKAFSGAGSRIALDDFGTGYSSLAYLMKFDIDFLKIDRVFVRNVDTCADDLTLCGAIVAMAHKLGLKVIVEGIENAQQLALMQAMCCDLGQGFHFSRAVPFEQLAALLDAERKTA
jgi:diguanylate cyclase (GGDEF)-like protein/PAS domain S-box-containing protein